MRFGTFVLVAIAIIASFVDAEGIRGRPSKRRRAQDELTQEVPELLGVATDPETLELEGIDSSATLVSEFPEVVSLPFPLNVVLLPLTEGDAESFIGGLDLGSLLGSGGTRR